MLFRSIVLQDSGPSVNIISKSSSESGAGPVPESGVNGLRNVSAPPRPAFLQADVSAPPRPAFLQTDVSACELADLIGTRDAGKHPV